MTLTVTSKLKARRFHRHYYEIEAETAAALGKGMGRLFGSKTHESLAEARDQPDWNLKVAAARPLLDCTAQYFPHYITELKSYSNAADIPFAELWTLNCEADLDSRERCTTIVTNGGSLVAHNEDWEDGAEDSLCLVKKRLPSVTILELYYYDGPLGGNALSVNSNGYVQAINSLRHSDFQVGVPKNVIARWLSETSDIEADFEALCKLPRASGYNHLLCHVSHEVVDVECTATRQSLIRPRLPFVHSNHYLLPEFEGYDEARPAEDSTFHRYAEACRILQAQMTVNEMVSLMDNRANGPEKSIMNKNTIGRVVLDWPTRCLKVWLKRESNAGWVTYPLDWVKAPPA